MNETTFCGFRVGDRAIYRSTLKSFLVQVIEVRHFGCWVTVPEVPNSTLYAYFHQLKRISPLEELARCADD